MLASAWLPLEERQRVAQAIGGAEKRTSAEFVVAATTQSDDYPHVSFCVILAGIFLVLVAVSLLPTEHFEIWYSPVGALAGMILGAVASPFVPAGIRRMLAGEGRMEMEVRQRAIELFYAHRMPRTEKRTGVMIFVSLLERRVVVWVDDAIAQKFPEDAWDEEAGRVSAALASSRPADALIAAIDGIATRLAKDFPVAAGDVDEIPNEVLVID